MCRFFYLRLLVTTRVSPTRYTTGYLQSCTNLYHLPICLGISQSLGWDVLECFRVLFSCGFFLKCVENASEESCDPDGVYVILQNQSCGVDFCFLRRDSYIHSWLPIEIQRDVNVSWQAATPPVHTVRCKIADHSNS